MKDLKNKKIRMGAIICLLLIIQPSVVALAATMPEFFKTGVDVLGKLVLMIGGGLAAWGIVNLLEGYGNDNPGANAHVNYTNTL